MINTLKQTCYVNKKKRNQLASVSLLCLHSPAVFACFSCIALNGSTLNMSNDNLKQLTIPIGLNQLTKQLRPCFVRNLRNERIDMEMNECENLGDCNELKTQQFSLDSKTMNASC